MGWFWWIRISASVVSIASPPVLIMSGSSKKRAISKNVGFASSSLRRVRNRPV
jgi:hypothetical protein